MTNYYEELKLEKTAGLDEIKKELSHMESIWKRREITNPEKATKMIALLIEARKVFSDNLSRSKYDRELEESLRTPIETNPNTDRYLALNKWKHQAQSYYETNQYDLAKTAIDKALTYAESDDDELFGLVADIYREAGNYSVAMEYINKAIVISPEKASYYLSKGLICNMLCSESNYYEINKSNQYNNQARSVFRMAISKAESSGDQTVLVNGLGALAWILYFIEPTNKKEAEKLATKARDMGGDPWGNAKRVLDAISEKRKQEIEEKRRNEEYERILADNNRKQQLKEEIKNNAKNKEKTLMILGWGVIAISVLLLFFSISFVIKQLCALIGIALIGYTNTYGELGSRNLFGDYWLFILIGGFVYGLISCTGAYENMGYGASQAHLTQLIFLIYFGAVVIVTFVSPIKGRLDYKKIENEISNI